MYLKCILLVFVLSFFEGDSSYYRPSCPVPVIAHGRVRPRQRGNFLKFLCNARYTLVGNKYATCRNRAWDVPIPVCVKSGCPQLEEVKNSVNMTYHYNAWVVFFCLPGHNLVGSPVLYCDGSDWNSTAPACVDSTAKPATECDFETPDICGWKLDRLHDFDWRRWNRKTPSYFLQTGPAYDHTYGKNGTGFYMYIESTGRVENETARLISPVYDASLAKNSCFVFYYHMFGRGMGGLRVYQKPDKVSMYEILTQKDHILFEQWGDQGNEWYSSVSMLSDVSDDFQIVIEGIRGESFMSDIAIDDVSIQHGENCSKALNEASTPTSILQESCVGRCDLYSQNTVYRGCGCSLTCLVTQNCCPDFLDACEFEAGHTETEDDSAVNSTSPSVHQPPQTEKLVATTTEATLPTTSTSSSTSTTTTTPRTIPTTTIASTTRRTTTRRTSPTTTTRLPIVTRMTKPPGTTAPTTRSTTRRPTPPKATTRTIKPIISTTSTTSTPISSSTPFFIKTTKHEAGGDLKPEKHTDDIDNKGNMKSKQDKVVAKKSERLSGFTIAITVLLVGVVCSGALWGMYVVTRSSRGVAALARIRGRTVSDPEVRYLKNEDDDDE